MRTVFASKKLNLLLFAIGLLGFAGASTAYASQAFSNWKNTGTVNGYTYQNESDLDNSNIFAGSIAETTNGAYVPTSYIGVAAHLYEANGVLCTVSGWVYNSMSWPNWEAQTTWGSYCAVGNYYSSGFSRAYNGNGYDTYSTNASPQLYF